MTVRTTPIFIDGNTHPAEETRLAIGALLGTATGSFAGGVSAVDSAHGVINFGDLAVTQNGTPNMTVNVAAGGAFIRGTQSANQGAYHLYNDGSINVGLASSDPTNPRRDLVIAQVRDAFYSGSTKDARITVVTGTAAASPTDPSLSSFPNALVLARVAVAANDTAITTAKITDLRTYARTEWNSPWGVLGHFSTTTDYSRNSTSIAEINTAFRLTVNPGANRRLKLTFTTCYSNASGGGIVEVYNTTTSAVVARVFQFNNTIGDGLITSGSTIISSPSVSTTYTVRYQTVTGGTLNASGSITPSQFTIEDIGPTAR